MTGGGASLVPGQVVRAWGPYVLLVAFVLLWSCNPLQAWLKSTDLLFPWPGLHIDLSLKNG